LGAVDLPEEMAYRGVRVVFSELTEGDPRKGLVPGYRFRIMDPDGTNVGRLNFRVGDTEHVRLFSGHIGYGIHPAHRGHGYAGRACLAIAGFVARVSGTVIITADPDNAASIRTILGIGGCFINEVVVPRTDSHYAGGSRRKRRYSWTPGNPESSGLV